MGRFEVSRGGMESFSRMVLSQGGQSLSGGALAGRPRRCWRCWGSQLDNLLCLMEQKSCWTATTDALTGRSRRSTTMLRGESSRKGKQQWGCGGRYKGCNASNAGGDDHDEGHRYPDTCIGTWATTQISLPPFHPRDMLERGALARIIWGLKLEAWPVEVKVHRCYGALASSVDSQVPIRAKSDP